MFFDRFDPSDNDPRHLVGRDRDRRWLRELLSRYLGLEGPPTGRAVCLSGEKGVGKSILTRSVLEELRADHSSRTLFLSVDCRSCHERRGVLSAVANAIVRELDSLRRATADVPGPLLANAQLLSTIARFDDCSLQVAHEQVRQYKVATELSGGRNLLGVLKLQFGLSLELTDKQVQSLSGAVRFDDQGLLDALDALFRDIRGQGFDVVLYLDNIDELRHEYRTDELREKVRRDVEGILSLTRSPIALVLNVRTYYSGVVPREIGNRRVLRPLAADALCRILDQRVVGERDAVRAAFADPVTQGVVQQLAACAPTALAIRRWVKVLFEDDLLTPALLSEGFETFLESYYASVEVDALRAVARAFPAPHHLVPREMVLDACERNQAIFDQMQDRQVVLPGDFWNPTRFALDPEMHFLHPATALMVDGS